MEPITNRRGHALLEFVPLNNEDAIDPVIHSPLTASLVVADYERKVLLVFDTYKQHWELPGGAIEVGESPRACAVRELEEESGQSIRNLDFVGVAKFRMKDNANTFATIYSGHLQNVYPFHANDEIKKIAYWDFRSDIGYVDEIDHHLARVVLKR